MLSLVSGSVAQLAEQGTHKPQVTGSSPVAATTTSRKPLREQGLVHNPQAYLHINPEQGIPLNQAVGGFILSSKVEGKSQGTIVGHTTLMITNRHCQAVGCYDAIESHKPYSPVDNLGDR